jgi:hypothetical protein
MRLQFASVPKTGRNFCIIDCQSGTFPLTCGHASQRAAADGQDCRTLQNDSAASIETLRGLISANPRLNGTRVASGSPATGGYIVLMSPTWKERNMSILWLTTALSLIALLSVAVTLGTLALGATAWLLSHGVNLLLASDISCRPAPVQPLPCRDSRGCSHHQSSRMLSA